MLASLMTDKMCTYYTVVFGLLALLVIISELLRAWRSRKYPRGPWGLPILGYLPFLNKREPYKTLTELAKRYGPVYSLRLGNVDVVVLADAASVREFLKCEEFTARAPLYVTHGIMGGFGLICSEGALWRNQRKHVIDWLKDLGMTKKPGNARKSMEQRIKSGVIECMKSFRDDSKKHSSFDPHHALQHTLGNIINDLVFGVKYARDDVTWKYLLQLQEKGLKLMGVSGAVNFLPWLRFLPWNLRSIRFLLDGKARTHEIYKSLIEKREQTWEQRKAVSDDSFNILDHFIDERMRREDSDIAEERLSTDIYYTQEQLLHLLADMFGAGLDTTLATMRWFLLYMCKYQEVQEQLRAELLKIPDSDFDLEHLEQCHFLRACISETQRIRSVVPLGIPHGAVEDFTIQGCLIPKNCMIIPLQWAAHMNRLKWIEPELYWPGRFLDDNDQYCQPADFIPFQTGKRMCPGEELARMMLFLYAGYIIRGFYIRLSQEHEIMSVRGENGITLVPKYYEIVATPMRNMKDLVKDDDVGMYKAVAVKKDIKSNTI
ncbi:cytochrome P450 306a1 [Bactrocera dorsalis]|uniref:Cytochrome P450 306a1 n=1 Tax=Bactrocera dorsalis TaxID=27457 RepID=A0A6I9VE49_BACDO|nr:cytochrome P450 306a1 [Bactrocera dorsalis]